MECHVYLTWNNISSGSVGSKLSFPAFPLIRFTGGLPVDVLPVFARFLGFTAGFIADFPGGQNKRHMSASGI